MEETKQRMYIVRKAEGITVPDSWPSKTGALVIPANKKVTLLIDQNFLQNVPNYSWVLVKMKRENELMPKRFSRIIKKVIGMQ